ncbi:MAG: hypothetical protein AB1813_14335 [Verrucomicrobiota bacterium]|jgi:hypothetical protein
MPAQRPLEDLRERKRLLVLQADLHRALLRAEFLSARERLSWLSDAQSTARSAGPWLSLGAAAIGLLAAWRARKLARWIPAALALWRSIRKFRNN